MIFVIKEKMYNFDPYNVLLSKYSCAAYDCVCAPGTRIVCSSFIHPVASFHVRFLTEDK